MPHVRYRVSLQKYQEQRERTHEMPQTDPDTQAPETVGATDGSQGRRDRLIDVRGGFAQGRQCLIWNVKDFIQHARDGSLLKVVEAKTPKCDTDGDKLVSLEEHSLGCGWSWRWGERDEGN